MKRSDANSRRISAIFWSRDPLPAEFASERFVLPSRTQKTFDRTFHGLSNGVDHFKFHMQMREILIIQSPVPRVLTLTILRTDVKSVARNFGIELESTLSAVTDYKGLVIVSGP